MADDVVFQIVANAYAFASHAIEQCKHRQYIVYFHDVHSKWPLPESKGSMYVIWCNLQQNCKSYTC